MIGWSHSVMYGYMKLARVSIGGSTYTFLKRLLCVRHQLAARAMRGNAGDAFWHQLRSAAARTEEGGARI